MSTLTARWPFASHSTTDVVGHNGSGRRLTGIPAGESLCGAPRQNRTGDPILTIDAPGVHNAMQHLAFPHNRPGEKRCQELRCGAGRGRVWHSFWQISGTTLCGGVCADPVDA
jgi:hypothetical protein